MCERERDCGDDHLLIGFTMMGFPMLAFLLLIEEFGGVGSGAGVVGVSAGGWVNRRRGSCRPLVYTASSSRHLVTCHASDKNRKFQLPPTELMTELLKSSNPRATASKFSDSLTEEFFRAASTYLETAKKSGNAGVVEKMERVLEIAMYERGKTLRPEVLLMNSLMTERDMNKRFELIASHRKYIMDPDSYFFALMERMTTDAEGLPDGSRKEQLLGHIRTVINETKEAGKVLRKVAAEEADNDDDSDDD